MEEVGSEEITLSNADPFSQVRENETTAYELLFKSGTIQGSTEKSLLLLIILLSLVLVSLLVVLLWRFFFGDVTLLEVLDRRESTARRGGSIQLTEKDLPPSYSQAPRLSCCLSLSDHLTPPPSYSRARELSESEDHFLPPEVLQVVRLSLAKFSPGARPGGGGPSPPPPPPPPPPTPATTTTTTGIGSCSGPRDPFVSCPTPFVRCDTASGGHMSSVSCDTERGGRLPCVICEGSTDTPAIHSSPHVCHLASTGLSVPPYIIQAPSYTTSVPPYTTPAVSAQTCTALSSIK